MEQVMSLVKFLLSLLILPFVVGVVVVTVIGAVGVVDTVASLFLSRAKKQSMRRR